MIIIPVHNVLFHNILNIGNGNWINVLNFLRILHGRTLPWKKKKKATEIHSPVDGTFLLSSSYALQQQESSNLL